MACFSEDTKCWGTWDITWFRRTLEPFQRNTGTISKAMLGKLLRDGAEHMMGFSEHVDTILNRTELVCAHQTWTGSLTAKQGIPTHLLSWHQVLFPAAALCRSHGWAAEKICQQITSLTTPSILWYLCIFKNNDSTAVSSKLIGTRVKNSGKAREVSLVGGGNFFWRLLWLRN